MNRKTKIFFSQPMKGRDTNEIKKERKLVEEYFIKKGCEVVDAWVDNSPPQSIKKDGVWYLGLSLTKLAECDKIIIFPGITSSHPGCKLEIKAAELYKIPMIKLSKTQLDKIVKGEL